jgi:hypothetical protein
MPKITPSPDFETVNLVFETTLTFSPQSSVFKAMDQLKGEVKWNGNCSVNFKTGLCRLAGYKSRADAEEALKIALVAFDAQNTASLCLVNSVHTTRNAPLNLKERIIRQSNLTLMYYANGTVIVIGAASAEAAKDLYELFLDEEEEEESSDSMEVETK